MRMRNKTTGVIANVDDATAERLLREGWVSTDAKPETAEAVEETGDTAEASESEAEPVADAKPETVKRKPGRPKKS